MLLPFINGGEVYINIHMYTHIFILVHIHILFVIGLDNILLLVRGFCEVDALIQI